MRKLVLSLIALASTAFGVCSPASAQSGHPSIGFQQITSLASAYV
jgi:hypothetical protein